MDNHKLLVTEPFGGICVHNAQQHQTVLDSLPSLRQRRLWLPRLKSKANEAQAKEPSGLSESFRKKIDTQKMSKGSAMSTEHNLCDSTSRGASNAVGNAIAGSPNCNNALQRTVMPPLFSAQYGPRDPSRDADSQRIQFEFAEFAANSFAARIRCEFGLKFSVLRIRGKFALRIRRRRQKDHACAVFTPDEKLTLNCAMQYFFGLDTMKTMMILLRMSR